MKTLDQAFAFAVTYEEIYGINLVRRLKQLCAEYPGDQSSLCWEGQDYGTPRLLLAAIQQQFGPRVTIK